LRTLRTIFEDAFNSFKWVALLRLEGLKRYLYVKVKRQSLKTLNVKAWRNGLRKPVLTTYGWVKRLVVTVRVATVTT